ncbi:MAG: hypothetical protein KDK70_29085, partial [Myxococcales bacterium]|nr:hypothetical protein [Myxococcales bacterium]
MSEGPTALQAVEPAGRPRVRIDTPLVQEHAAPWWVLVVRALVVAAALLLPLEGALVLAAMVVAWLSSGWVIRYPVDLPPGRVLFEGGVAHSDQPGRRWLRPRRTETAYSIDGAPLRIDWRPAPTGLQGPGGPAWLELSLVVRVRPRDDEVGQFLALLQYHLWHDIAASATTALRREIIG